jgi:hypothetical protein
MEGFSKAIQQPEYVHVLLNHFPITGLFVACLFLLVAILNNNRSAQLISLVAVGVLALSAWPVAHYGEQAYDRVLSMTDDTGSLYLKHHEELADRWIFLYYLTAGVAAVSLVVGWKKPKFLRLAAGVVALLAVGSLIAGAVIADCGGKIRHREFRYGPPPSEQHHSDSGSG